LYLQRIAIARALLKNAPILILDEVSAIFQSPLLLPESAVKLDIFACGYCELARSCVRGCSEKGPNHVAGHQRFR
jgi:hypothetical protein